MHKRIASGRSRFKMDSFSMGEKGAKTRQMSQAEMLS